MFLAFVDTIATKPILINPRLIFLNKNCKKQHLSTVQTYLIDDKLSKFTYTTIQFIHSSTQTKIDFKIPQKKLKSMSDPSHMYANIIDAMIREEMKRGTGPTPILSNDIDVIMTDTSSSSSSTSTSNTNQETSATLKYAYQTNELMNLELMKRHEGNAWRAYNQDTEQSRASIQHASQQLTNGIEMCLAKRKRQEEDHQRSLDNKRRSLYGLMKNVADVRMALD